MEVEQERQQRKSEYYEQAGERLSRCRALYVRESRL